MSGLFLSFEGIEGAGKSTQVELLVAALQARGADPLVTREPGGTALGAAIRDLLLGERFQPVPLAELFLILADRAQHVAAIVRPALGGGRIVVADRFADSTIAYQAGGRGLDRELVETAVAAATGGIRPHLTLLLDLPVGEARARVGARGGADRLDAEGEAFYERVRGAYRLLYERQPGRIKMIDARADSKAVHRRVLSHVLAASQAAGMPLPDGPCAR